jgi:hypothetical protein
VTLQELCAGVPLLTVFEVDAGTRRAHPVTLRRLAAVLGLAPDALRDELDAAAGGAAAADEPAG